MYQIKGFMKQRFLITVLTILSFSSSSTYSLSYQAAITGAGLSISLVTAASYAVAKRSTKNNIQKWFTTALLAAPFGYIASVLWLGLTPEARYLFGVTIAKKNNDRFYAIKSYDTLDDILREADDKKKEKEELKKKNAPNYTVNNDAVSVNRLYNKIVNAHQSTLKALKSEAIVLVDAGADNVLVDSSVYQSLKEQEKSLKHNADILFARLTELYPARFSPKKN